jgi:hypothetical protein
MYKCLTFSRRYKIRQFAERLPDGTVPITGFNTLLCVSSENDYAKTIARCIYFLARQKQMEPHSSTLEALLLQKVEPHDVVRMSAVQSLLWAGIIEVATGAPYAMELFIELYYVIAPNGAINRSASFVSHVAVHLLYAIRGVYILQCADTVDVKQHIAWSESILNEQEDNTLSAIQSLKRVAVKYAEDPESRIIWLDEGLQVRTERGNVTITPADIRKMYHNLLSQSEAMLMKMEISIMSAEELAVVVDLNSRNPGEGIMSMNTKIFEFRQACSAMKLKSEKDQKEFCILSYELGKVLTMSLYLAGGPSARLTEIANWMVACSEDNCLRNLRYVRNLIVVANTYSKSDVMGSKSEVHLVCYSDEHLTALVMTYLVHVKRLEHDCSAVFGDSAQKNSRLCFLVRNGEVMTGTTLGLIFRHEFLKHNLDISISDMRHVMEAYARKIGCLLESEVRNNPLCQLSNHSIGTSNVRYGKSTGDLPHVPADRMQECYLYCKHWNVVMLNSEAIVQNAYPVQTLPKIRCLGQIGLTKRNVNETETIISASSLPSQVLSQMFPIDGQMVSPDSSLQLQANVLAIIDAPTQLRSEPAAENIKISLKRRREVTFTDAMQMLGMHVLRPFQQRAYDHLKEHHDKHSLIILPTGTGKSKLVALDAITRGVCNVLFVPYVAIKDEVIQQGKSNSSLCIVSWSAIKYDFESAANDAQIVVAGAEQAGQSMISFLQLLHNLGRLGCCFVDEADVLLQEFRALKQFWTLAAGCKLVIVQAMTATLRPRDEALLANTLGVDTDGLMVVREPCMRDDIELSVRFFQTDHASMRGLQLFLAGLPEVNSRVVIFMMTTYGAEELGSLLKRLYPDQVSVSHSRHKEALKRIAVVTSCFGHGVNIEGLTHVCIIRSTWSIEGFVQVRGAK